MSGYRGLLCGLGVTSLVLVGSSVPAFAGSATKTYYGGGKEFQEDAVGGSKPTICNAADPGIAEVCFKVGGPSVDITIADASGQPTPARVWFYDDGGNRTQDGVIICAQGHVDLPDGTTVLDVRIGPLGREVAGTPPPLPPKLACGQPEPVTTGTVTVSGPGVGGSAAAASHRYAEPGQRGARIQSRAITTHWITAAPARSRFTEL
jgi:hypothetical protein